MSDKTTTRAQPISKNRLLNLIPFSQDPIRVLAEKVHRNHKQDYPDLTRVVILLPGIQAAQRLRTLLCQRANKPLLGPTISTLSDWVITRNPSSHNVISDNEKKLMLAEALLHYTTLPGGENPWALANHLGDLFNTLTQQQTMLPDNYESFVEDITSAYGVGTKLFDQLNREARLVHTLWQACHQQQLDEEKVDPYFEYIHQVKSDVIDPSLNFFLLLKTDYSPSELQWINKRLNNHQITLFQQGKAPHSLPLDEVHPATPINRLAAKLGLTLQDIAAAPSSSYSAFIDDVFSLSLTSGHLNQRANLFKKNNPLSPASQRFRICIAADREQEAHVISTQLRIWYFQQKKIAVISDNRKLIRRLRALLERYDIDLQDTAGWALSTTSAAAMVERWLQTIESDFFYQPLLDLLKSPFLLPDDSPDLRQEAIFRFEEDVVFNEKITSTLCRYQQTLKARDDRISWADYSPTIALLNKLEQAGKPLIDLVKEGKHNAHYMLDCLMESLHQLGFKKAFAQDPAGEEVYNQLTHALHILESRPIEMSWSEFREWLGSLFENALFKPPQVSNSSGIKLLSLSTYDLDTFDAIIIASCDNEYLPGKPSRQIFFNDPVRKSLGLPDSSTTKINAFYHFRRLLDAAPTLLITSSHMENKVAVTPCPWLSLVQSFHQQAYQHNLEDNSLINIVEQMAQPVNNPLPSASRKVQPPSPSSDVELFPDRFTAYSHQQLINCPYQFFSAHILKLEPTEEIKEVITKPDYGKHVHRILEAFHSNIPGLPGPIETPITNNNRLTAETLLRKISRQVFYRDLQLNYQHQGWYQKWLSSIPHYITWQIKRETTWRICSTEQSKRLQLTNTMISGRLDRVDQYQKNIAVTDYKTGQPPSQHKVEQGEAVQLPFYALLAGQQCARAEYLTLENSSAKSTVCLEGDALNSLAQKTRQRLEGIVSDAHNGLGFTAWGDPDSCQRCKMNGLCRKQSWQTI